MSKILRLFTVSLLLAGIMIATVAGPVFAAGGGNGDANGNAPDYGDPQRDGSCGDCDGDGPWWSPPV